MRSNSRIKCEWVKTEGNFAVWKERVEERVSTTNSVKHRQKKHIDNSRSRNINSRPLIQETFKCVFEDLTTI